jgi:hypothetical protein
MRLLTGHQRCSWQRTGCVQRKIIGNS